MADEDLFSPERRFGTSFFDEARAQDALRDAQPGFLKDGSGIRGSIPSQVARIDQFDPAGKVSTRPVQEPFPPQKATSGEGSFLPSNQLNVNFAVSNAGTKKIDDVVKNRVLVLDGKINGTFPAGMGFNDTYILNIDTPNDCNIYAGISFNPTTLEITSRFLGVATNAAFPVSKIDTLTSGFLYWLLAFTYLKGTAQTFTVRNVRLGNINVAFNYGQLNGVPALLPILTEPSWLAVPL